MMISTGVELLLVTSVMPPAPAERPARSFASSLLAPLFCTWIRSDAARKYLTDLGSSASIDTVSFGEERPLCTEANEACWARNRRAEIMVSR